MDTYFPHSILYVYHDGSKYKVRLALLPGIMYNWAVLSFTPPNLYQVCQTNVYRNEEKGVRLQTKAVLCACPLSGFLAWTQCSYEVQYCIIVVVPLFAVLCKR